MSSRRSQRHTQKPERFVEIQQSLCRFHGRKDTYDRHFIQIENIQLIKQKKNEFHGYDGKDGFVVNDEEVEDVSSEEENDEELVPSDTESENEEEEELDLDSDSDEEIESEQEESD
jgi:hypothetical protein